MNKDPKKPERCSPAIPYLYRRKDGVVIRVDQEPICPDRNVVKEDLKVSWNKETS